FTSPSAQIAWFIGCSGVHDPTMSHGYDKSRVRPVTALARRGDRYGPMDWSTDGRGEADAKRTTSRGAIVHYGRSSGFIGRPWGSRLVVNTNAGGRRRS